MKKVLAIAVTLGFLSTMATIGSPKEKAPKSGKKSKTEVADTTSKPKPKAGTMEAIIKPHAKVQRGGMFAVYEQEGKYYLQLPKSLLERDLLLVNRLSKAAAEVRSGFAGYAGDEIQEAMVRFVESPDGKNIFLQNVMTREIPRDSVGQMREAVMRSNFQPIVAAFKIEAQNQSKDSVLIDATDYINGDNDLISFDPWVKKSLDISRFQKDKSYIVSVKSYPMNIELRSVKTYMYTEKGYFGTSSSERPVTFEINSSMVLLPKDPMRPRYDDRRVGYFTDSYIDYEKNPQGVKDVSMISRFRLEPKDSAAYMRGELVEPIKPIIFYIDPTTPKKWVPYLIQGINDWQEAFEQAGFKNAIYALEAPTKAQDSTWSLEDARFNAIVYKPSDIPNASGPHVSDPRSGESMETHINWYHNVQKLLRNWYMLQAGPNDPRARQMTFPDSLMGQLIRFVSSHEVGHTLGLRHNMGATSLVPVDSLRSGTYLQKYGHTPSIMDYSRFNYAVQPEDNIPPELQWPRIKEYDKWAIEFGYRYLPQFKTADQEVPFLNQWVIENNKNPRLWFGHEMNPDDPRSQTEDLGDNQMKANALGIKNLKRVVESLPQWTKVANENYAPLREMYYEVLSQYMRYIGHVSKWVGGEFEDPKTIEQGGVVYTVVPKEKQIEAMTWLKDHVFENTQWLNQPEIFAKTGVTQATVLNNIYRNTFPRLLSTRVLGNLAEAQMTLGNKAYTLQDLFNTLNTDVWGTMGQSSPERRIMQTNYVKALLGTYSIIDKTNAGNNDARAMVEFQLRSLMSKLKASQSGDPIVKGHYQTLAAEIEKALDPSAKSSSSLISFGF